MFGSCFLVFKPLKTKNHIDNLDLFSDLLFPNGFGGMLCMFLS